MPLADVVALAPTLVTAVADLVPQQVYYVDVPEAPVFPYILLSVLDPFQAEDTPVCGVPDSLVDTLYVTMVHSTPGNVAVLREATRSLLNQGNAGQIIAGAWVKLAPLGTAVQPDLTAPKVPATDRHPFYAVDTYTVHRAA